MWFADVQFNTVTFIILVIAVGISVDYSGHIARCFMTAQGTRQVRAWGVVSCVAVLQTTHAQWRSGRRVKLDVEMLSTAHPILPHPRHTPGQLKENTCRQRRPHATHLGSSKRTPESLKQHA